MSKTRLAACRLTAVALGLSLAAGVAGNRPAEAAPVAATAGMKAAAEGAKATEPQQARQNSAQTVVVDETIGVYDFVYSYPGIANKLPGLKRHFEEDIADWRNEVAESASAYADMIGNDQPGMQLDREIEWKLVTSIPGWISLSGELSGYDGGTHPNFSYLALLWNSQTDSKVNVVDLFLSPSIFETAVSERFNNALNHQRREKRGGDLGEGRDAEALQASMQTIILGSSDGQRFNRIGFLVSPYRAGPYVEGTYEVTLAIDDALLDALKPEYRRFFGLGK